MCNVVLSQAFNLFFRDGKVAYLKVVFGFLSLHLEEKFTFVGRLFVLFWEIILTCIWLCKVKAQMLPWNGDMETISHQTILYEDINIWLRHGKSYIWYKLAFAKIMVFNKQPQNTVTEKSYCVFTDLWVSLAGFASQCRSADLSLSHMVFISLVPIGYLGHILMVMA